MLTAWRVLCSWRVFFQWWAFTLWRVLSPWQLLTTEQVLPLWRYLSLWGVLSSDERWTSVKNKTVRFSPLLRPVAELPTNQRLEGYIVTGIQAFIVLKWNVMLMERQGLWFLSPLFRSVCISRNRLLSILGGRNESPHFSTVFYCANVIH